MMYLAVSVSGFLVILTARTRKNFTSRAPGAPLGIATVFALSMSTLISFTDLISLVGGSAYTSSVPITVALFVWAYCLTFFLLQDFAKVFLIRYIERNLSKSSATALSNEKNDFVLRESFWQLQPDTTTGAKHDKNALQKSLILQNATRSLLGSVHGPGGSRSTLNVAASGIAGVRKPSDSILNKNSFVSAGVQASPEQLMQPLLAVPAGKAGSSDKRNVSFKAGDGFGRPSAATTAPQGLSAALSSSLTSEEAEE